MLEYILNVNLTNTADQGVGSHVRYPVPLSLVLKNLFPCFWNPTVMLKTFFRIFKGKTVFSFP